MATEHAGMSKGHETARRASRNVPGKGKEKGNIPNPGECPAELLPTSRCEVKEPRRTYYSSSSTDSSRYSIISYEKTTPAWTGSPLVE